MRSSISRGLLAGAVGTAFLEAVTYADMALTGRPASEAPAQTVAALLRRSDRDVPDDNRLTALGELGGIGTGLAIGVVVALVRKAGIRLPAVVAAPATGALAMAATDLSMARLDVSDPRSWTAADWTRDIVPHLAYGIGVRATLDALEHRPEKAGALAAATVKRPRRFGRSVLLGLAAGSRSSFGFLAVARLSHRPAVRLAGLGAVVAEMVGDKLPTTPSRLEPGPLLGRWGAGAVGGFGLARKAGANPVLPVVGGVLGAAAGSVAGAAWRDLAAERGWTWQAGLVEDGVATALALVALR